MASEGYGATGAAAPDAVPAQRSARDVMDDIRTTQKFGGRDGYPMPRTVYPLSEGRVPFSE